MNQEIDQTTMDEAIVEAWCALDDVKETSKQAQGDLHLLSHNLHISEDLPKDAILRLALVHDKIKEWMSTVEGCVSQVVESMEA